jgi:DNA-binding SARP family transcriptional activator
MELRILGPLEVRDGERSIALGGAKQRGLLAILLLHANEVVSADRLIDELWGDDPPATAAHTVQVYVSNLRKALRQAAGREVVVTRPPGYVVETGPDELDLARFERLVALGQNELGRGDAAAAAAALAEALALWRGQPLADFAYERFAQAAIARLEELRISASEARIEADLALGRHALLVPELQALVAAHPLRERLRSQLMLALYRSGRQADALEAFQEARRALVDGLGIDPGPALQQLERAILNQDPLLELESPAVIAAGAPTARASPERAILVGALDAAEILRLLELAEPLARSQAPHELLLARVVSEGSALGATSTELNALRGALAARGVPARTAAFTSGAPARDLVLLATEQDVDLLLVGLCDEKPFGPFLTRVLEESPCDVGLIAGARPLRDGAVLVPFGGAVHDWAALELGAWLASAHGAVLRLVGVGEGLGHERDASRLLAHAALSVQQLAGVDTEPLLVLHGAAGVVEAGEEARIVVLGLAERWRDEGLGKARSEIAAGASAPVVFVRRGVRPGGLAPRASLTRYTWSLGGPDSPSRADP